MPRLYAGGAPAAPGDVPNLYQTEHICKVNQFADLHVHSKHFLTALHYVPARICSNYSEHILELDQIRIHSASNPAQNGLYDFLFIIFMFAFSNF